MRSALSVIAFASDHLFHYLWIGVQNLFGRANLTLIFYSLEEIPPCKTYLVDKSTYHPIRLSDSLYIVHGSSFLRYRVQCPGKKLDILEVGPDTMMSKVELDDGWHSDC